VRVSLINGVTSGLMNISRSFAQAHGHAVALQRQLDQIKFKLLAGAALTGTGLFGLSLIEKTVPAAREYAHQIQQMNVAGMKQVEIANAVAAAWGIAGQVPTASATDNLKAIRELRMVFGNSQAAIANVVTVQKLQAILQNTSDGHGGRMGGDQAYTVAKALEMKGAVKDPADFTRQADMMAKAMVASGGKVGPQDFLSTFKYGRGATQGWGDHFAYEILPTLIQEMKSSGGSGGSGGPGNALMSVYDKVINGKIAQKDLPLWAQLGMLDQSKVVRTKTGSTKGVLPGAVVGWEEFQKDPFAWTQMLMKRMADHGITDPAKQQMMLSRLGGTRTAGFMLQQMGMQGWKFDRDVPLIRGASGLAGFNQLVKSDPMMAQQALEAQWTNVKTRLGLAVLPMLILGTTKLTTALTMLSNWMGEHSTLTKGLVLGFTALSAAMAFGGAVLLLSAAFSGIGLAVSVVSGVAVAFGGIMTTVGVIVAGVAWPITLCVAALTGLGIALYDIIRNWDASKGVLANIKAELGMFFHWLADMIRVVLPGFGVGSKPVSSHIATGKSDGYAAHGHRVGHQDAAPSGSRFVAHRGTMSVTVVSPVYVDSKLVAPGVAKIINGAIGSTSAAGRFDPTATIPSAALGNNR
jgi:hypothetical protein